MPQQNRPDDIWRNPQNYSNDQVANEAIRRSIVGGELDMGRLNSNLNVVARTRATHDEHWGSVYARGQQSVIVNTWVENYNIAARESLGVIDSRFMGIGRAQDAPYNLECEVPRGVDFRNLRTPMNGNVECEVAPPTPRGGNRR